MAPHSIETILRPPQWPLSLSKFVTWCLMWDPRSRPTSAEAMRHEYFTDAVDPARPKSSGSRVLGRNQSSADSRSHRESTENPTASTKPSWFRKSLIRDQSPPVPVQSIPNKPSSPRPSPVHAKTEATLKPPATVKYRPFASKRATWTNGAAPSNGAPMPILPSIRPISPFSDTVTAQSHNNPSQNAISISTNNSKTKKIGRQLSVQSNGNHYADYHRQEAERALNGQRAALSPNSEQKEGFFSHLRKRARRLSGKPQTQTQASIAPSTENAEPSIGCSPWQSNHNSMVIDSNMDTILKKSLSDVDKALQSVRYSGELLSPSPEAPSSHKQQHATSDQGLERHPSLSKSVSTPCLDSTTMSVGGGPVASKTRRALHRSTHPSHMYDTPDEEDELLHEALNSAHNATKRMDRRGKAEEDYHKSVYKHGPSQKLTPSTNDMATLNPYPTPSPSAKRNGMLFDQAIMAEPVTPLNLHKTRATENINPRWPTPPYEENEWASSAAASIFAASSIYQ